MFFQIFVFIIMVFKYGSKIESILKHLVSLIKHPIILPSHIAIVTTEICYRKIILHMPSSFPFLQAPLLPSSEPCPMTGAFREVSVERISLWVKQQNLETINLVQSSPGPESCCSSCLHMGWWRCLTELTQSTTSHGLTVLKRSQQTFQSWSSECLFYLKTAE